MMLLETRNLIKTYKQRRVVNKVSIHVEKGEIVGLLGPNGAGKTTTFNMIVGLIAPENGEIIFHKRNITKLPNIIFISVVWITLTTKMTGRHHLNTGPYGDKIYL